MVQPRACAAARSRSMGYRSTVRWRLPPIGPVSEVAGAGPPPACDTARSVRADLCSRDGRKRRTLSHRFCRLSMINSEPVGAGLGRQATSPATSSGVGSSNEVTSATAPQPVRDDTVQHQHDARTAAWKPWDDVCRHSGRLRSSGIRERRAHQLRKSSSVVSGRSAGARTTCSLTLKRGASIQAPPRPCQISPGTSYLPP